MTDEETIDTSDIKVEESKPEKPKKTRAQRRNKAKKAVTKVSSHKVDVSGSVNSQTENHIKSKVEAVLNDRNYRNTHKSK